MASDRGSSYFPPMRVGGVGGGEVPPPVGFNTWNRSTGHYVRIQPHVLLSMYDALLRDGMNSSVIIGTLLGFVSENGAIEITGCFKNPYTMTANEVVSMTGEHHASMLELQQHVSGQNQEQVVGGVFVGNKLNEFACAIHGWYRHVSGKSKFHATKALPEPILLHISPNIIGFHVMFSSPYTPLQPHPSRSPVSHNGIRHPSLVPRQGARKGKFSTRAYCQIPLSFQQDSLVSFYEMPVYIADDHQLKSLLLQTHAQTLKGIKTMNAHHDPQSGMKFFKEPSDLHSKVTFPLSVLTDEGMAPETRNNNLSESLQRAEKYRSLVNFATKLQQIYELLSIASEYVKSVLAGTEAPDPVIGRLLMQIVRTDQSLPTQVIESLKQHSIEDTLMMCNVTNLAKAQIGIAQKLATSFE